MSLPEEHRARLKALLEQQLGPGPISFVARAWAVKTV